MFKGGQIKTAALLGLMSGLLVMGGYWATGTNQGAFIGLGDRYRHQFWILVLF